MADRYPPMVVRNDFCECKHIYGLDTCYRAICGFCGNYLAYHMATAELARSQAEHLLADRHWCMRGFDRSDDEVHRIAKQREHARRGE